MRHKEYHIICRALRNMKNRDAAGNACIELAKEIKSEFAAFNVPQFFIEADCSNGQYFNTWLRGV